MNETAQHETPHLGIFWLAQTSDGETRLLTAGCPLDQATNLRHLTGGNEEAKRFLRFVVGNRYVNNDLVARLLHDWAGTSAWGQLHYDLWVSDKGDAAEPREVAPDVAAAAAELRQLPLIVGTKAAEVSLPEMSMASRAAWRRTLAASVATNEALRADVTEALLWYGANREDMFVQVTALEINAGNRDAALGRYKGHPAKVVRLRAASALALATGEPGSPRHRRWRTPRPPPVRQGRCSACLERIGPLGLPQPRQEIAAIPDQ